MECMPRLCDSKCDDQRSADRLDRLFRYPAVSGYCWAVLLSIFVLPGMVHSTQAWGQSVAPPESGASAAATPSTPATVPPSASGEAEAARGTLASEIDRLLAPSVNAWAALPLEDGAFLRRLSLDTRGVVPTGEELREYQAEQHPDKRQLWIKRFMEDPLHQERMVDWIDKTLLMRRPFTLVDRAAWLTWLRQSVERGDSLKTLAKQILTAPWWDNSARPALRFFLDRGGDPHLITRDLSRVFLGRDMQCNQCHNHPLVEEYRQIDYHGLYAFVSGSSLVEATTKDAKGADVKFQMYVERPGADAPFESVFEKGVAFRTLPRLPISPEVKEAFLEPDKRVQSEAAAGTLPGVPKPPVHSRRHVLADQLLEQQQRAFARNMANRLWALVFGRGLVHPLDMHHADNPPSHPELLELLTDRLIEMQFSSDVFLQQLLLTRLYTLDSQAPSRPWPLVETTSPAELAVKLESNRESELAQCNELRASALVTKQRIEAELASAKETLASREKQLEEVAVSWRAAQGKRHAARTELDKAEATFNGAKKKSDDTANAEAAARKKQQDTLTRIGLLDEVHTKLQQALALLAAEDAELKNAAAIAKAKADAARGETAALEKAVVDTSAAAAAALAELGPPRDKVKEMAAALEVENQALAPVDQAYAQARIAWGQAQAAVRRCEAVLERNTHRLALCDRIDQAKQLVADLPQAEAASLAAKSELPAAEQRVVETTDGVTKANAEFVAADSALTEARKSLTNLESELALLRDTIQQLEKSAKLVAMPEPLNQAITVINDSLASKSSATAQLTAAVAAAQLKQTSAMERLNQATANRQAAVATRDAVQSRINQSLARIDEVKVSLAKSIAACQESWDAVEADRPIDLLQPGKRALTPEQLGLSFLRVTGVFDNYVRAELAELEKKAPLAADADAVAKQVRQRDAVRGAMDKLRGNVDVFASLYASGVGQTADDFFASPDQALYVSNAGAVFSWSGASGTNLAARMVAEKDQPQVARDLYNTLLARAPSQSEQAFVVEQLAAAGDARAAVCQELVWAVLSGVEFRFYR